MSNITKRVTELPTYGLGIPNYTPEMIIEMENNLTAYMVKKTEKALFEFFEPFLRKAGIKGEITKGKIKWRGLKMHSFASFQFTDYQLFKRGEAISPTLRINYPVTSIPNHNNLIQ